MKKDQYKIVMTLKEVTQGDVMDLAQQIWDDNAHDLDAELGEFTMKVTYMGKEIAWGGKAESGAYDDFGPSYDGV